MEAVATKTGEWPHSLHHWKSVTPPEEDEMEPGDGLDLISAINGINFNLSNVQEIFDLLKTAPQATNKCLLNECDIIYECRACNNLFRSLANFVAHKRHFCLVHKCENMVAFASKAASRPKTMVEDDEDLDDESPLSDAQSSSSEEEQSVSDSDAESEPTSSFGHDSYASNLEEELAIKKEQPSPIPEEVEEESFNSSKEDDNPAEVADEDFVAGLEMKKELGEESEGPLPEPIQPTGSEASAEVPPPPVENGLEGTEESLTKTAAAAASPTKALTVMPPSSISTDTSQASPPKEVGLTSPESNSVSQTLVIDGKGISNSLGKSFKNCTLKLPRGIMEKFFVPVDTMNREEGGDPAKRNSLSAPRTEAIADGSKPAISKLAMGGKRFAILNPQLFAKFIKENSKPFTIQSATTSAEPKKVAEGSNSNHKEDKTSPTKNSPEPIRLKVSKLILEPPQQQEAAKDSPTPTAVAPKASEVTKRISPEAAQASMKRSSSSESDEYKDIKKLFIDSDPENSVSDAEEGKQEKKPLIVVISKSSKEQQPTASIKTENEEQSSRQKKTYNCEQCPAYFCTKKALDCHMLVIHEKKRLMYPCPFCEATLGQAWSVMRHIMAIHKRPKEEYDSLKRVIKKNAYFKEIDPNEPMELEEGGEGGYPIGSLKCSTCQKPFDRKNALATHERYCSKSLVKPAKNASPIKEEPKESLSPKNPTVIDANLNVHSRPKRAPSKKEFKDYINSQTLKLNYISKSAPPMPKPSGKSSEPPASSHNSPVTKQFSVMEASMLEIINLQKLECLRCKKTFNNTSNLKRHAASHFGWCRFGCASCSYKTYNKSDCKMHILKTHKEDDPEKLIVTLSDFKAKINASKLQDTSNLSEGLPKRPTEEVPMERKKKRKNSQTFRSLPPSENSDLDFSNISNSNSPLVIEA